MKKTNIKIGFEVEASIILEDGEYITIRNRNSDCKYSNSYGHWGYDGYPYVSEYRSLVHKICTKENNYRLFFEMARDAIRALAQQEPGGVPLFRSEIDACGMHVSVSGIEVQNGFLEEIEDLCKCISISLFERKYTKYDCQRDPIRIHYKNGETRYELRILPSHVIICPYTFSKCMELAIKSLTEESIDAMLDLIYEVMKFNEIVTSIGLSKAYNVFLKDAWKGYCVFPGGYISFYNRKNVVCKEGMEMPIYDW